MILIRKFEPKDFPWVIEIERKAFDEHDPYFYMKFYETCSDGFIVAKINGIVIGFIVGFLESEKRGRIFSLAVHPDYQNRRIGSFLLKELINVFKTAGAVEIILEVRVSNIRAKKFYERHGFIQAGIIEKYYNDGENAYLMKLNI
ncbi:MAG: ribosomal protein S18-alanine N-acetyltransferase [Candidatus Methanoperedens sp.]|nr:ribosomal protein S18-alanine N-acetyltransferase [Candidatus Methanoperedens sp.]MCE8424936.1 ribosomal protein S18-alanine N-acetyltransferase [Candidatus Methanoperedens sp.]MCE8427460.1 ribosomal protein S18-alanine N-acetyltransferase [Candidatus Methanoperedens sp.]